MLIVLFIIALIGVFNIDSLWRGTKLGDIVNDIMAVIVIIFLACLVAAF